VLLKQELNWIILGKSLPRLFLGARKPDFNTKRKKWIFGENGAF